MTKISMYVQKKVIIIALTVIVIGLIAVILLKTTVSLSSNKGANESSSKKAATINADIEISSAVIGPEVSYPVTEKDIQSVDTALDAIEKTNKKNESNGLPGAGEAGVTSQNNVTVKSIQDRQPLTEIKATPPPKPVPQSEVTNKVVRPDYKEQDVKPQKSQPVMGEKNDKGQIYVEGFGWVKDEGGGGKGTTVGDSGDQLTGNKVGVMD